MATRQVGERSRFARVPGSKVVAAAACAAASSRQDDAVDGAAVWGLAL